MIRLSLFLPLLLTALPLTSCSTALMAHRILSSPPPPTSHPLFIDPLPFFHSTFCFNHLLCRFKHLSASPCLHSVPLLLFIKQFISCLLFPHSFLSSHPDSLFLGAQCACPPSSPDLIPCHQPWLPTLPAQHVSMCVRRSCCSRERSQGERWIV